MKNLKRIISLLLVAAMFVTCITVLAVEDEVSSVTKEYVSDLSPDKSVNGRFSIAAIRTSDGLVCNVDPIPRACSSEWVGNYVDGLDVYVTHTAQISPDRLTDLHDVIKFDMRPTAEYSSAIAFTAPADGVFSASAFLSKMYSGNPEIIIMANGIQYAKVAPEGDVSSYRYNISAENIPLKTGEQLFLVVQAPETISGVLNCNLISFDVVGEFEGCPHEWDSETGKCSTCGEACAHNETIYNGATICTICRQELERIHKEYISDLALDKTVDGQFSIGALGADGTVYAVDPEPRTAGNYIVGTDIRVTSTASVVSSRTPLWEQARFDMLPTSDGAYSSAIVFTAPADGIFAARAVLTNTYTGNPEIVIIANGTVCEKVAPGKVYNHTYLIAASNIKLSKGQKIILAVQAPAEEATGLNPHFVSFDVDGFYTTCPHAWDSETGKCTECGEICTHDVKVNAGVASCSICGYKPEGVFINHISDLTLYNPDNGHFSINALSADGVICKIDNEPIWRNEHYAVDYIIDPVTNEKTSYFVHRTPSGRDGYFENAMFDMYLYPAYSSTYSSAAVFTAPEDGIFSASAELSKSYYDGEAEVVIMANGTEYGICVCNTGMTSYSISAENIKLEKGDQLLLVARLVGTGEVFLHLNSFDVQGFYEECPHNWNGDNTCDACGFACPNHDMKNAEGTCATCGMTHKHEGGEATCKEQATCTECGLKYGNLDLNNHASAEFTYVDLKNGTHEKHNACCKALVGTENCTYTDHVCDYCGYFNKPAAANDTLDSVVDKWLAGTDIGVTPEDFDETVLAGADVTKPAPDAIKGFEYALFNLDFDADGNIFIRHHFFIEAGTTVTVNADTNLVNEEDNYYYYDVTLELGNYDDAATIVANDGTNSVTIEASLYSYIKVALESGELDEDQANFLKVLCQLNEMAE